MPLTFAEAKLQYNPDPAWDPKRGSAEYQEILTIMKHSGATFHKPANKPLEVKDVFRNGEFKNPIIKVKPPAQRNYTSKKEFCSIKPNSDMIFEHMCAKANTAIDRSEVPEIVISKATLCALKTQAQCVMDEQQRIKKMSKKEFLTMKENKEYVRQHMLLNKK
jgi:hypothetical protein